MVTGSLIKWHRFLARQLLERYYLLQAERRRKAKKRAAEKQNEPSKL
jgi:hypothetical protein